MEENLDLIIVQEELQKLDKDYFHTCVEVDEKNNIKWQVYYSNMNDKDYLKRNNRPILESINNNLKDIKKLNMKFESMKKKAETHMFLEKFDLYFDMFKTSIKINDEIYRIFKTMGYCVLAIIILLFALDIDSIIFAAVGTISLTLYAILFLVTTYISENIDKYINQLKENEENRLLKAYLKDRDMKGLKDEFTKKDRKKFIEENKEYRPKRKKVQSGMERLEGIQKAEIEQ